MGDRIGNLNCQPRARFTVLIPRFRSKPLIRWEFRSSMSYPKRFSDFESFPVLVSSTGGGPRRIEIQQYGQSRPILV
jgi:hypothetical protein